MKGIFTNVKILEVKNRNKAVLLFNQTEGNFWW